MTDVEQKVVQMRFDDKEFDEKAKKTMKTLDKLNEKLSFDAVAQRSDAALNEMVDNVEKIADKAYTIVDRVIDKIKDSIATKIFSFLSDTIVGQVKSGWSKYAEMTQAVGTLAAQGHKMEVINEVLERLSFFSDETNYNFNNMLNNISKFTAAGVKLEDAEVALEGIAGMAGLSGVNAQRAAIAMDQMAQAMGSYLKKADWVSIQTANLDTMEFRQTLIDTALELGTLKKAANNTYVSLRATSKAGKNAFSVQTGFLESLTQGAWATTEVMVETYKKYGAAVSNVYDKVEAEGITASEAINDLTIENKSLLEQYQKQYNVTSEIAEQELNKISLIRKATDEEIDQYATLHKVSKKVASATLNSNYDKMLKDWQKRTHKTLEETERDLDQWAGWTNSKALKAFTNAQEARTFEDVINSVKEAVSSNWRSIYTSIFGDYAEAKKLWTDMANGLVDLFAGKLYDIAAMFKEWKGLEPGEGGRTDLWQGLYAFAYGIRDIIEEVREVWNNLITDGEKGLSVLQTLTLKIKEAGFRFYTFVDSLINEGFFADITEALHNIKAFIDQIFGAFYQGVRDAVPGGEFFKGLLLDFAHILKELTSNFKLSDEAVDGLRRTFKGLTIILNKSKKTFVEILVKVVLPILNAVFSVLGNIVEVVLTITGTLGDIIEYFMPLDGETSALVTILEVLTDVLTSIVKIVGKGIMVALKAVVPLIGVVIGSVATLIEGLKDLFTMKSIKMGGENKLFGSFVELKNRILEAWAPLESFNETINKYKNGKGLINFLNLFADITEGIGNRLLLTVDAVVGFFEVLSDSKFGKAFTYAIKVLRWFIRGALWLFNNLFVPALKEIIAELGLTIESVKGIIQEDGILGLLNLIQEVFKTGIFGEIVNTINLINSILGANGIGKLFSRGAKALESIADYFNAAKMNQAAEIMLKIIAAMTLLYTLLALITFLPIDRYERMKEVMLDFGIALGIVVAGVFVISAAAALAGGNLVALAGAFVGIAVAIGVAFWALKKMSNLIDEIEEDKIDKAMDKLNQILSKYSWIIIKVIAPFALLSTRYSGSIAGIGAVFVGLAASIYVLIKAMQEIDSIQVDDINKIAEFVNGIYLVFAASTALMVFAANGKDVHGISIAIASIGVAFAAIKLILPLCKDVIAEKDVILEAQSALATFGLFVLAFSASMYFITSGVNGVISGIVSILLFSAFLSLVTSKLIPIVKGMADLFKEFSDVFTANIGKGLNEKDEEKAWKATLLAIASLLGAILVVVFAFREIFGWWGDVDPMSFLWIAVTIVGGMAVFAKVLLPAVQDFGAALKTMSPAQIQILGSMLLGLMSPIFALAIMFVLVMWKFQNLYDKLGMARIGVNIGIFTRQYNAVASMFQSIMLTFMTIYLGIIGILSLVTLTDFGAEQMEYVSSIMSSNLLTVFTIVGGIAAMWIFVMKHIRELTQFSSTADAASAGIMVKNIAGAISWIMLGINILMLGTSALVIFLIGTFGKDSADKYIEVLHQMTWTIIGIMATLSVFAIGLILALRRLVQDMTMAGQTGSSVFGQVNTALGVITACVAMLTILSIALMAVSAVMALWGDDELKRYKDALITTALTVGGVLLAIGVFIAIITTALNKNALFETKTYKAYTHVTELIVALGGIFAIIVALGVFLVPAVAKLENMELDKIIWTFGLIIALLLGSAVSALLMIQTSATQIGNAAAIAKVVLSLVIPLAAVTAAFYVITNQLKKLETVPPDIIQKFNIMMAIFLGISSLFGVIATVASSVPQIAATIATVALAIGGMVALIGFGVYMVGKGIELIRGIESTVLEAGNLSSSFNRMSRSNGENVAHAYAQGINDNLDISEQAGENLGNASIDGTGKSIRKGSPSKEFMKLGKFCDQGLALGIKRNTKDVAKASRNLGELTQSVFADDLEIASPSKVFYKNGRFIVAGLQDGITSKKTSLADTMSGLGESLANSINSGFENVNIDIWGGKDPIETIKEGIKDVDAGSILGKIFGLDGEEKVWTYSDEYLRMVKTVTNSELNALSHAEMMGGKTPDWFANRWVVTNKSTGTKLAGKAKTFLKDVFDDVISSDTIKGIAEDLGLKVSDEATGTTVLDSLKKKIIGDEKTVGVIGTIKEAITTGDWASLLGNDIGGSLVDGAMKAIRESNFGQRLSLFMRGEWGRALTGTVYSDLVDTGTVYQNTGNPYEERKRAYDYWKITKKQYEAFRAELTEDAQRNLDALFQNSSELVMYLPENINADDLFWEIEDDFGGKFSKIIKNIGEGAIGEIKVIGDKIRVTFGEEDEYTINEIAGHWEEKSPSRVMRRIYRYVGEGAILGIEDTEPTLLKTIKDCNDEQYREMSLGVQALDSLASGETLATPSIVPVIDTAGFGTLNSLMSPYMNGKVTASLDFTNTFGSIATSQQALANAVNSMARDIIGALNIGELIKVDVNSTVNDGNLFDHFVTIDRQEYNRTGHHAW